MRLFFALLPPAEFAESMAPAMTGVVGARWQAADQLHLTLRFVGEVDAAVAAEMARAFSGWTIALPPIWLAGAGQFGRERAGGGLWLRAHPHDSLQALHRRIDDLCQSFGLAAETREFIPHITLARLSAHTAPTDDWLAAHDAMVTAPVHFPHCALVASHLTANGSIYRAMAGVAVTPIS